MTKSNSTGPRQSTFDKGQRGASLDPDNLRVSSRPGNPRGIMEEGRADMPKKKARPMFNQTYYQKSTPHQDYLHGNPDSRRSIEG